MRASERNRQVNITLSEQQYLALMEINRRKGLNNISALVRSALVDYFSLPTDGQESTITGREPSGLDLG